MRFHLPRAMAIVFAIAGVSCGREPDDARFGPISAEVRALTHVHSQDDAEARVLWFEAELRRRPTVYANWALLAAAYLDQAKAAHGGAQLGAARRAAARSLELQPSYEGYVVSALVANFGHHFEEALSFCKGADDASPAEGVDARVLAMRVEALLALGRVEEAARAVDRPLPQSFHLYAATARVREAEGRTLEAIDALYRARDAAKAKGEAALAQWAQVSASRLYLLAGRVDLARSALPPLSADESQAPDHTLTIAWAALLEAEGDREGAHALYARLLAGHDEPTALHRAWANAVVLGRDEDAKAFFARAERTLKTELDAGEIHPAGALARLYVDAHVRDEEANALAKLNFQYRQDAEAKALLRETADRHTHR